MLQPRASVVHSVAMATHVRLLIWMTLLHLWPLDPLSSCSFSRLLFWPWCIILSRCWHYLKVCPAWVQARWARERKDDVWESCEHLPPKGGPLGGLHGHDDQTRRHTKSQVSKKKKKKKLSYSRKYYWWELHLAVEPKIAIARILTDFNLAAQYGIAIRIICEYIGNFGGF